MAKGPGMPNEWARKMGQMLRHVRPGVGALATSRLNLPSRGMVLRSAAFEDGGIIPERYTQDGDGLFPPLAWEHVPAEAQSLALIVEDADAPFPRPLVHAVIYAMPAGMAAIGEGGVPVKPQKKRALGFKIGRNSVARAGWMAPSPMPGHGPHRYAFQLFAFDTMPFFAAPPGRSALLRQLREHLVASTRIIGVYQRN